MSSIPAIISIHDVMPNTLEQVEEILSTVLCDKEPSTILLLVVPGLAWEQRQLDRLKKLQNEGYELAGHGWQHRTIKIAGWYHRLHSWLISRQAAEHLSQSEQQLARLIEKNYQWFIDNDFKPPQLYVPPAWAMGKVSTETLSRLPFRGYESTRGILFVESQRFSALPLVGFEADNAFRHVFLGTWNRISATRASALKPLRIAIHPNDLALSLSDQLCWFCQVSEAQSWQKSLNP